MKLQIYLAVLMLTLFSSCGNDEVGFNQCSGDVAIQYEVESTSFATPSNQSDVGKLTPYDHIYALPRTERAKVEVCYSKDGTYFMHIQNMQPKQNNYANNVIGTDLKANYSRAEIKNGEVRIYGEDGTLENSIEDNDFIDENKKLVENILNTSSIDKNLLDKLAPTLKAAGHEVFESKDNKYVSWKVKDSNGDFSLIVFDKEKMMLSGIQQYDVTNKLKEQTIINAERSDDKIIVKGFSSIEYTTSPFSKIPMKRIYNSKYENFTLLTSK